MVPSSSRPGSPLEQEGQNRNGLVIAGVTAVPGNQPRPLHSGRARKADPRPDSRSAEQQGGGGARLAAARRPGARRGAAPPGRRRERPKGRSRRGGETLEEED